MDKLFYYLENIYSIGKIKSSSKLKGNQNDIYSVKTQEGEFILKLLGRNYDKKFILRLKEEFLVLNFLKDKNFPYEIPHPIKNKRGVYFSRYKGRVFWIYRKIKGHTIKKITFKEIKEIAKALSALHKFTKKFKVNKKIQRYHKFAGENEISSLYKKLRKIQDNNALNNYLLKHIDFMETSLIKAQSIESKKRISFIHSDLNSENVLFRKGRLVSIIDFENINYRSCYDDLAYSIKMTCFTRKKLDFDKVREFINQYSKINPLNNDFMREVISKMIIDNCVYLSRAYNAKISFRKKFSLVKWTIETTKNLTNILETQKFSQHFYN